MPHGQILAASEKSRSGTVMLVLDESFLSEVFTVDIVELKRLAVSEAPGQLPLSH